MKVVIAGGSGFLGTALIDFLLKRGDSPVVLSRSPADVQRRWDAKIEARLWNGRDPGPWVSALDGADAVVNLSGESVAGGRWTPERKLALIRSRVDPARALVKAMGAVMDKPMAFVSASAVGYYGAAPAGECAEDAPQGSDFLAALCGQWEREAWAADKLEVRTVMLRLGVALAPEGGALAKMLTPFKLGLGGPLGSGRQPMPWIHRDDAVGAILFAIDDPSLSGPVNAVAPEPATSASFARSLGRALHRPAFIPAPGFVLRLALGEMSSLLLDGQAAVPKKLLGAGFKFRHPALDAALMDLVS